MISLPTSQNLTLPERVVEWVQNYVQALEENYTKSYPNSSSPVEFDVESGRKYWKIIQNTGGVHAFVDKKTGQVYKPASWRGPAKHVRYDLRIINDRIKLHDSNYTDWAGGYLYMR